MTMMRVKKQTLLMKLFKALMLMMTLSLSACDSESIQSLKSSFFSTPEQEMAEKWGIKIIGLRSTMYGLMIDFRFKVLDKNKAPPLFDKKATPYLIVEKSQAKLLVPNSPNIGNLRQTPELERIVNGRDFFVLFGNPRNRLVKKGDKVTVVIGDFKVQHLELQ